jgi:hypothetical protein
VLHSTRLERLARDKHSSLFDAFENFANKRHPGPCSQHFSFFITYERAQKARVLHWARQERPARDKHSSLFGQFESFTNKKHPGAIFITLQFLRNL